MEKSLSIKSEKKYDDAASVVAAIFEVSPRYVRLVVADTKKKVYKGLNPDKIRRAYYDYKKGKSKIIKAIEEKVKVAA